MTDMTRMTASPLQLAANVVGAAFLAVGVLGFVPGVTVDYGQMEFAGHESAAELFGLFQISISHNLVHLAFGVVGLALGSTVRGARNFLIGAGVVYLALWVYGLVVDGKAEGNFVPLNTADDWLHLGLGAGMVVLGIVLSGRRRTTSEP